MPKATRVYIGTSGWHYPHWQGPFYPEQLPKKEFLPFYLKHFTTAEINNSFYNLPEKKTLQSWKDIAPRGFLFSAKASRYITHMKKLKDPKQPLSKFLRRIETLGDSLGPILFQLPPNWKCNPDRLGQFLEALPPSHPCAFEFRDPSWFTQEIYEALSDRHAAFCIYQLAGTTSPRTVTTDFVYIRLHGPNGAYEGKYTKQQLSGWSGAISAWVRQGKTVYCYFDNDQNGYAAENARQLDDMLHK